MAEGIMILAKSGRGKTTSLRNFEPDDVMIVQCKKKRLPFPHKEWKKWDKDSSSGSIFNVNTFAEVNAVLQKMSEVGKKVVVIDDLVYLFANQVMAEVDNTSWDKWTQLAIDFDSVIKTIESLRDDMRVYILTHPDEDENGETKMKSSGKLIEKLLTPEGNFTVVLGMTKSDNGSFFITNGTTRDPYKSPMGMFKDKQIPNDLQTVDTGICDFWDISSKTTRIKNAI